MKTVLILGIIIAVAAVAVATYLAFSGMIVSQSAEETLQAAASKVLELSEYSIDYSVINSIKTDSDELSMQGTMGIAHTPSGERLSIRMQSQSEAVVTDIYNLPEGTFSCSTSFSGIVCERLNETLQIQNPVEQAAALLELSYSGFVNIQSQGSRTILGRRCDAIAFTYDIPKLLANASLPEDVASGLTEMSASMCFDSETGMPIDYELGIKAEAEVSIASTMRMTATSLELTAHEITLPENATIY
jgi:hypothetical protein